MLLLKYLLIVACFGIFGCVAGMVLYDIFLAYELDRLLKRREKQAETLMGSDVPAPEPTPPGRATVATLRPRRWIRWSEAAKLSVMAAIVGLLGNERSAEAGRAAGRADQPAFGRAPRGALRRDAPDRAVARTPAAVRRARPQRFPAGSG